MLPFQGIDTDLMLSPVRGKGSTARQFDDPTIRRSNNSTVRQPRSNSSTISQFDDPTIRRSHSSTIPPFDTPSSNISPSTNQIIPLIRYIYCEMSKSFKNRYGRYFYI